MCAAIVSPVVTSFPKSHTRERKRNLQSRLIMPPARATLLRGQSNPLILSPRSLFRPQVSLWFKRPHDERESAVAPSECVLLGVIVPPFCMILGLGLKSLPFGWSSGRNWAT